MDYLKRCEELVRYKVRIVPKEAFVIVGYTLVVPPGQDKRMIGRFWDEVIADGRLEALQQASSVPTPLLGLGSWDPACQPKGMRYTIGIEATEHTDFANVAKEHTLFPKDIGASDWMCFETSFTDYDRFWRENPYKMMGKLGYQFHTSPGYTIGLHFEVYPPGFDPETKPEIEFWITVVKAPEA